MLSAGELSGSGEPSTSQSRRSLSAQLDAVLGQEFGGADQEVEREASLAKAQDAPRGLASFMRSVIEHRAFSTGFMVLTFYAIFAPDLDVILGDKASKVSVSIVTTVVFGCFFIQLILQSCWKPFYIGRAYFWLDLIALISLIPDTYMMQVMFVGDAFVSGDSYWLLRIMRLSRSSKATRLNRLTRIVRVAALMPRLLSFGRQKNNDEAEKLVEKKLLRVFNFMDDNMDGGVATEVLNDCLARLRGDRPGRTSSGDGCRGNLTRSLTQGSLASTAAAMGQSPKRSTVDKVRDALERDAEEVSFGEFLMIVNQDEPLRQRLLAACRQQLRRSNNMQNLTSRHSEDVGVKVALGVLLMLLVLTLVEPAIHDHSATLGLQHIDAQVRERYHNYTGDTVPLAVQRNVEVWMQGTGGPDEARDVVYLDLGRRVYCNEFARRGQRCAAHDEDGARTWARRGRLEDVDEELRSSPHRWTDLVLLRLPDLSDADVSGEDLNRRTDTVAVLDGQSMMRHEALMSVLTTILVIVIILLGIVLLTKDLAFLSSSLLKPLRALAEEMQSIVQLQLAGLSEEKGLPERGGTAEIRQIQRIFDNMKKAIKSWGKYVPWPVVQLLLHAGVDAKPGVEEREVTLFFSDIAGFTSIVESMEPENSLLLLSRYFNDMSKVIDDHGGIVIEFIGDAIMSVFGAPLSNPDHATAAVKSTLRMLLSLGKMNEWSAGCGLPEVRVRCGIHTGKVLVGNMGFHSRMKYGVVGENANIPERLEGLNKVYGTEMLISQTTCDLLDPEAFVVRPIDLVRLRKTRDAAGEAVFQVMARERRGRGHRLRPVAEMHSMAFEAYRVRDFARAAGLFGEVGASMEEITGVEDTPSVVMAERCRAYIDCPPPPDWDGVWD